MALRGQNMKIILASGSPRRRELLERMGVEFEVMPMDVDETLEEGADPREAVLRLAVHKAAAASKVRIDGAIIAADTLVECGGQILGKPADEADACRMVRLLSGCWHNVLTGICVVAGGEPVTACEVTKVHFTEMSDSEVAWYVSTGESMDKAGAYGIQGYAGQFIDDIQGDYFNVMGLPMAALARILKNCGVL